MTNKWVYDLVFGKEGTQAQKNAAKLSGAQRAFPLNSYVGVLFPYNIKGRVEDYRLLENEPTSEVEIKVNGKWYPKYSITKSVKVLKCMN